MARLLPLVLLVLAILWLRRMLRRPVPPPASGRGLWDPHAVLGIPPGASADAIAHAYRARLKEYHPDRVATLGAELQELAHRKTLDIQRAYAELSRGSV